MSGTRPVTRLLGGLLCALLAAFLPMQAVAQQKDAVPEKEIEDLGNQRYRIGNILIDKAKGEFTVPGKVMRHDPPIEFVVTMRKGSKSYETILEIDADALQFNLACILIGLDAERATPLLERRRSPEPIQGDRVDVSFNWTREGQPVTARAGELLLVGEPPAPVKREEWVYTGSAIIYDRDFLAQVAGTIMGFARRGESIIEHRHGIGLGDYGGVLINTDLLPAIGESIEMTVRRSDVPFPEADASSPGEGES